MLAMARVLVVESWLLVVWWERKGPTFSSGKVITAWTLTVWRTKIFSSTWRLLSILPLTRAFLLPVCMRHKFRSLSTGRAQEATANLDFFLAALLALVLAGVAFARTSQSKHRMVLRVKWGRERSVCSHSSSRPLANIRLIIPVVAHLGLNYRSLPPIPRLVK